MNADQATRFQKVSSENFYLLNLEKNANDNLVLDVSGSTANLYQTTIYPKSRTVFCSCPDARSGAKARGCVCKHVCFILSRVFKIPLPDLISDFFRNHLVLTDKLMEVILTRYAVLESASLKHQEFVNEAFLEKFQELKLNASASTAAATKSNTPSHISKYAVKKELDAEEELECMICYDIMQKDNSIECPLCHNLVHKGCMEKWLKSGKKNCIYCRSDVWKDYNKDKAKPTASSIGEYKNLLS